MDKICQPQPVIRSTAEFASHIGLRTTISRVRNGQPELNQIAIDDVQRALVDTGFTPKAHALHLKGKRSAMMVTDSFGPGLCVLTQIGLSDA